MRDSLIASWMTPRLLVMHVQAMHGAASLRQLRMGHEAFLTAALKQVMQPADVPRVWGYIAYMGMLAAALQLAQLLPSLLAGRNQQVSP